MIGTTLGTYRLDAEIRCGGMATVYRATDTESGRVVALKVLARSLTADRAVLQRFRREVAALRQVRHPYVVRIFDVGSEGSLHYYAMEYLEHSLADRLHNGPIDCVRALEIAGQVARGLQAVHAAQIYHRDVKPSNILFAPDGSAKISDFGIAKVAEATRMTQTGAILGTPTYMAPEQAEGLRVDARADVYSLGIVLYEMLVGRPPFDAPTTLTILHRHRFALPEPPKTLNPLLPASVSQLVLSMLEKSPAKRPASMGLLANTIEGIRRHLAGEGQPKRPTTGYHDRTATHHAEQLERAATRVLTWAKRIAAVAGLLLAGLAAYQVVAYLLKRPADYLAEAQALEEKDLDGAIDTYEALVKRFPDSPEAPTARSRISVLRERREAERGPVLGGAVRRHQRTQMAYLHFRRAREAAEAGRLDEARRIFQLVCDHFADTPWGPRADARLQELDRPHGPAPKPATAASPATRTEPEARPKGEPRPPKP